MKKKTNVLEKLNYKRSVISDGSRIFTLSSYDDQTRNRRVLAVYDHKGHRVDEAKEKELIASKGVESPLFAPREEA